MRKTIQILMLAMVGALLPHPTQSEVRVVKEQPLAGYSVYLSEFIDAGGTLYDEDDMELLAEVMYHENYNNGEYIMLLTGSVVLNRVADEDYPNSIKGVLYAPNQYSTAKNFGSKQIPDSVRGLAKELLIFGSIAPPNVVYQAMFSQGHGIFDKENTVDVCGEYFCYK